MEAPEISPQFLRFQYAATRARIPLSRTPMPMDEVVACIPKGRMDMSAFPGYEKPILAFVTRYSGDDQYELAVLDERGNVVSLNSHYPASVLVTCLTSDIQREVNFGRLKAYLSNP